MPAGARHGHVKTDPGTYIDADIHTNIKRNTQFMLMQGMESKTMLAAGFAN